MLIELFIYVMIGLTLTYSFNKYRKFNRVKAILTIFCWPFVLLHYYVELVEKVKCKHRKQ